MISKEQLNDLIIRLETETGVIVDKETVAELAIDLVSLFRLLINYKDLKER